MTDRLNLTYKYTGHAKSLGQRDSFKTSTAFYVRSSNRHGAGAPNDLLTMKIHQILCDHYKPPGHILEVSGPQEMD